jgi:hypothetical protein
MSVVSTGPVVGSTGPVEVVDGSTDPVVVDGSGEPVVGSTEPVVGTNPELELPPELDEPVVAVSIPGLSSELQAPASATSRTGVTREQME